MGGGGQKTCYPPMSKDGGDTYPYPPGIYALGSRKHNSVSNISCYGVGDLSFFMMVLFAAF